MADRFAGGSGAKVFDCQWHGCPRIAEHRVRRGFATPFMAMCAAHRDEFRELPDIEAFRVADNRKPERWRFVPRMLHAGGDEKLMDPW